MSAPTICEDKSTTFTGWAYTGSQTLKPWGYHPRPLGPKDVEIEITHGGCCGSDIHTICGHLVNPTLGPIITGHEIVGRVVAAGAASGHKVGELVGSGGLTDSCGQCFECKDDQEQLCSKMAFVFNDRFKDERGGITQGGFADRIRINGHFVHKIPANIPPAEGKSKLSCFVLFSVHVVSLRLERLTLTSLRTIQFSRMRICQLPLCSALV